MQVGEMMTRRVIAVDRDTPLHEVRKIFEEEGFHHVLVIERRELFGIISDRDVLRHLSPYVDTLAEQRRDVETLEVRAHQVMSRCPVTIDPGISVAEAASLLVEHRISCLPVLENERVCGLVTTRDIVRALVASNTDSPLEIERKYLLSAMPKLPAADEVLQVRQGYLPGEVLVERVRHVVRIEGGDHDERFLRTVKHGLGLARLEIEERTSRELFEALFALTEGARIEKRRHRIVVGDHVWEIDEFLDRELVLAEVELKAVSETPAVPKWMKRVLVREVTEEREFTNWALARGETKPPDQ